jgi:hypothetical protein
LSPSGYPDFYALPQELDEWLKIRSSQEPARHSAKNGQAIPSTAPDVYAIF